MEEKYDITPLVLNILWISFRSCSFIVFLLFEIKILWLIHPIIKFPVWNKSQITTKNKYNFLRLYNNKGYQNWNTVCQIFIIIVIIIDNNVVNCILFNKIRRKAIISIFCPKLKSNDVTLDLDMNLEVRIWKPFNQILYFFSNLAAAKSGFIDCVSKDNFLRFTQFHQIKHW